ncbi:MAG TPA: response regulator [Planctomycetota bacterium]|nr:response regulator [Planctomycetota bacterium]
MASRSVLVVDDDPTVGRLVAAVLRREDLAVEVVLDGDEALARLATALPALVLTDMTMPGLSGLELVRAAEARGFRVPFLVMSAFLEPDVERRLLEEGGVSGVLRKPFDIARLVRDVRAVLDRQAARVPCWSLVRWEPELAWLRALPRRAPRSVRRPPAAGAASAGAAGC